MALIKCAECGKEISDRAETCPSCGNPIHQLTVPVEGKIEIVQTAKKWKKTGCAAVILAFIGFMTLSKSMPLGFTLLSFAFIIAFISRIGAWWTNG